MIRHTIGKHRSMIGAALLAAVALTGCVENDVSITINQFIPIEEDCTYDPMVQISLGGGTYDTVIGSSYGAGYYVGFVIQNNLPTRDNIPVEVQAYYVQSYDIELEVEGPAAGIIPSSERSFNVKTATMRLAPGALAAAAVDVFQPGQLDQLAENADLEDSQIIARIRPVVTRAEEETVGAFSSFPIRVCNGCLIRLKSPSACPFAEAPMGGNKCNPAADKAIPCCQDGSFLRCGEDAPVMTMP